MNRWRRKTANGTLVVSSLAAAYGAATSRPTIIRLFKPLMTPSAAKVEAIRCRTVTTSSPVESALARPVLIGAVAATLGDILIAEGDIRRKDSLIFAGAGAFATSHLASLSVLAPTMPQQISARRVTGIVGSHLVAAALTGTLLLNRERRSFPVLGAYGAVLATMSAFACLNGAARGDIRLIAGAVLFVSSDTLIAIERTLLATHPLRPLIAAGISGTYSCAQALLIPAINQLAHEDGK